MPLNPSPKPKPYICGSNPAGVLVEWLKQVVCLRSRGSNPARVLYCSFVQVLVVFRMAQTTRPI